MMLVESMMMDSIVEYPRHVVNDPYARQKGRRTWAKALGDH